MGSLFIYLYERVIGMEQLGEPTYNPISSQRWILYHFQPFSCISVLKFELFVKLLLERKRSKSWTRGVDHFRNLVEKSWENWKGPFGKRSSQLKTFPKLTETFCFVYLNCGQAVLDVSFMLFPFPLFFNFTFNFLSIPHTFFQNSKLDRT